MLSPQGLSEARVAARRSYRIRANWKLIWANNRECWHCHVGHPDYVRANYDAAPDTPRVRAELEARTAELLSKGLLTDEPRVGILRFPTTDRWWSANRTPNAPGFVTESLDGLPVGPLMGAYDGHDVGTLRARVLPGFWCHASADHAVTTRLLPAGPIETAIEVVWLVAADAEEARDYDLDRLLPFWETTSQQDWALCERNQRGILSSAYRPGPYSPSREANLIAFDSWYLAALEDAARARRA